MLASGPPDPVHLLRAARAGDQKALGQLLELYRTLPPDYGEVIILRHLEGLPLAEVAERMGRSLDSVKKLWVRGIAKLREILVGPEASNDA
jgi:RNA polymerase sigma factor (sigma-70 family)